MIIPRWALLVVVAILTCVAESPLGPAISSHVWSMSWVAIDCPSVRFSLGTSRCTVAGK